MTATMADITSNKAPGKDGLIPELIKKEGIQIVTYLRILFNRRLDEENIPDNWKKGLTILIHKKGVPNKLNNYRPIALLSAHTETRQLSTDRTSRLLHLLTQNFYRKGQRI